MYKPDNDDREAEIDRQIFALERNIKDVLTGKRQSSTGELKDLTTEQKIGFLKHLLHTFEVEIGQLIAKLEGKNRAQRIQRIAPVYEKYTNSITELEQQLAQESRLKPPQACLSQQNTVSPFPGDDAMRRLLLQRMNLPGAKKPPTAHYPDP